MYKRVKIKKLGRTRSHRHALIKNQLRSLFASGKLQTTTVKAKVLSSEAQSLLKVASKATGNVNKEKKLSDILGSRNIAQAVLEYVKGGSQKVTLVRVGYRDGDNAQISRVQLDGYKPVKKSVPTKKKVKSVKKEEKKEVKKASPKRERKSPTKIIKETFSGRKQRATSRSGL